MYIPTELLTAIYTFLPISDAARFGRSCKVVLDIHYSEPHYSEKFIIGLSYPRSCEDALKSAKYYLITDPNKLMIKAAENNATPTIKYLLEHYQFSEDTIEQAFIEARHRSYFDPMFALVKLVKKQRIKNTALREAIKCGHDSAVLKFLKYGAIPGHCTITPYLNESTLRKLFERGMTVYLYIVPNIAKCYSAEIVQMTLDNIAIDDNAILYIIYGLPPQHYNKIIGDKISTQAFARVAINNGLLDAIKYAADRINIAEIEDIDVDNIINHGYVGTLKLLLDRGARINLTDANMHAACTAGLWIMVKILHNLGQPIEVDSCEHAAMLGCTRTVETILRFYPQYAPAALIAATAYNRECLVKSLLRRGTAIEPDMYYFIARSHVDMLKTFIKHGCDIKLLLRETMKVQAIGSVMFLATHEPALLDDDDINEIVAKFPTLTPTLIKHKRYHLRI